MKQVAGAVVLVLFGLLRRRLLARFLLAWLALLPTLVLLKQAAGAVVLVLLPTLVLLAAVLQSMLIQTPCSFADQKTALKFLLRSQVQ